jgi:hypothetical protein
MKVDSSWGKTAFPFRYETNCHYGIPKRFKIKHNVIFIAEV